MIEEAEEEGENALQNDAENGQKDDMLPAYIGSQDAQERQEKQHLQVGIEEPESWALRQFL